MHRSSARGSSLKAAPRRPAALGGYALRVPPHHISGIGRRPCRGSRAGCVTVRAAEGALAELAQRASLALLTSTSSAMMSSPDFIQPDLQQQLPPLLEPPTAQVLEFDRTIPRSGDVVQYIVRAIDEDHQNPALSEARHATGWSSDALDLAVAITSLPQQLWNSYCRFLDTHPLPAKLATGAVGTLLGDMLAQFSAAQSAKRQRAPADTADNASSGAAAVAAAGTDGDSWEFDAMRCMRLVLYSVVLGTPLCHVWFAFLDTSVFPDAPTSAHAVITKVVMDQAMMAPFGTSLFFMSIKAMEGHPEQALPTVRSRLLPTLLASYLVWPAAHVVNFALVPPEQRILYVNCVSILWTAYLSHMANEAEDQPQQQPQDAAPAAAPHPLLSAMRRR